MNDLLANLGGGVTLTSGVLAFLDFIRDLAGSQVISGYFRYDTTRVQGSSKIEVERIDDDDRRDIWWYHVKRIDDYAFVRIPLVTSGIDELLGTVQDEKLPDADYWRWVARGRTGVIVSGQDKPPNAKVDFVIVGFRPSALLRRFSST